MPHGCNFYLHIIVVEALRGDCPNKVPPAEGWVGGGVGTTVEFLNSLEARTQHSRHLPH